MAKITKKQLRDKINRYFRIRHNKGKGSWAENHDLAMDMQKLCGVLPRILNRRGKR